MKMNQILSLGVISAVLCSLVAATPAEKFSSALLGDEECLDGPSYWCQNFTTARQCNANRHCIRTVWEHKVLPPDNGEICETCKKMVAQARDELKSNETQENLKLVLEGSCLILIPIKPIARECVKMVDEFIPELIEALSSQMDPQVVCSVAGLCNSARLDKLVAKFKTQTTSVNKLNCANCEVVAGMADRNFRAASKDHVLNSMLEVCGDMGSFSDGCAANLIIHFHNLYESLAASLNPEGVCHLAGVCHQKYHNHSKVAEVVEVPQLEGDMPCELCEQLVQHLRDVLVANTTEKEFERVLLGICGQTKQFKEECVKLVEDYYPLIYTFLTEELNGTIVCTQIGICPKKDSLIKPLYPLLPANVAASLEKDPASGLHRVPLVSSGVSVHSGLQPPVAQLPLDSLVLLPGDKDLCQMCEFFLHFLQDEMTDPVNEQVLIDKAKLTCNKLPQQFAPPCRSFVDQYARAVIALLAQDIDPSQVCPKIGVCPGYLESQLTCEPCKTTAFHLTTRIGTNTTEANIKNELLTLCLTMPFEDSRHCSRLLALHQEDFIDMVVAEFSSEEMCFYMKYCIPPSSVSSLVVSGGGDVETNEIPKTYVDEKLDNDICVMCEFVMKTIEKDIQDKKTEEEIRKVVEHVCFVMPSTVRPKCKQFVDQYIDLIVTLLAQSVDPEQICRMLNLCSSSTLQLDYVRKSLTKCIVCESLMGALQGVIEDSDVQRDVNHQLELACLNLPRTMRRECQDIVRQMAPQIEVILEELPVGILVCRRLQLCGHTETVDMVSVDRCGEGQNYWCASTMHAATCEKINYCQQNVWLADKPNKKKQFHSKKIVF